MWVTAGMTQNNKLKVIGVTGITGSGTSTVSAILAEAGGFVISADKLAHDVMQKGQPAYERILKEFPVPEILLPNGEINRKVLGSMVFANPQKLTLLEAIIHPQVIAKTQELLLQAHSHPFAVIDAPLLIESEMHKICDSVWLITATDDIRIARIKTRDGIDNETATRRLKSRKGDSVLRPYANVIIENNGELKNLHQVVVRYLNIPRKET